MNPLREISLPHSPSANFTSSSNALSIVPVDNTINVVHRQETQSSLRQASVALDAAYERVTQLRHNINNLLNRMPPEFAEVRPPARDRTPESTNISIPPQHAALAITSSDHSESDLEFNRRVQRLRTIISPSARQGLEDFENMARRRRPSASDRISDMSRNRSQRWDAPPDPPSRLFPPRARSPPLPDLILPANNWSPLSTSPEERSAFRRELGIISPDDPTTMIGRRVAARSVSNSSEHQNATAPSLEQQLQDHTVLIARDLAGLASRLVMRGVRHVEPARQPPDSQQATVGSILQDQGTLQAPSDTDMEWEPIVIPQPAAAPNSSTHTSSGMNRWWTSEHVERPIPREELGQGASLPQRQLHHLINARETTANTAGESFASVRRRRGWARINADGNEIISDDEDNIERNRRSRLRLMYALPDATVSSASPRSDEDYFLPFSTIIHSLDEGPEAIRVRINSHHESKEDVLFQSSSSRTYPPHVDPLPTPISEMLRHSAVPSQVPQCTSVSKYASLAGR